MEINNKKVDFSNEIKEESNKIRFAELIEQSKKEYEILHVKPEYTFHDIFNSYIDKKLIIKGFECLQENHKRKLVFRSKKISHNIWDTDELDNVILDNRIIYNLELKSIGETAQYLINNDFFRWHCETLFNWMPHTKLLNDIFETYIINENLAMNYCFYGGLGLGKTSLLTNIARFLYRILDINVYNITMPSLLQLITSINEEDKHKLELLKTTRFLFVDDIGQEKYNTDTQESNMRNFFVYRYQNCYPTFIAGNADIKNKNMGIFYTQLNNYMNDSKRFKIIKLSGKSKRTGN